MNLILGEKSKKNLIGVHPHLIKVVETAIGLSQVDFRVHEGFRSAAKQKEDINNGVSWTMNSRHLTGHAVDLVPFRDEDGDGDCELSWDWPSCYQVAKAMQDAANDLGVPIVWGGVWDRRLNDLSPFLEHETSEYAARQKARGKSAKLDGPHFELDKKVYT